MTIIDARGLSCPQPVLLAKKALDEQKVGCKILVDNQAAVQNVTRYATKAGYSVSVEEDNEDMLLNITK